MLKPIRLAVALMLTLACRPALAQPEPVIVLAPPPPPQCRITGGSDYIYYDQRQPQTYAYHHPATTAPNYPYDIYYPYCPPPPAGQQILIIEHGQIHIFIGR